MNIQTNLCRISTGCKPYVHLLTLTLLSFVVLASSELQSKTLTPVIFIPGYGGSQLEAKRIYKPFETHSFCNKRTEGYFNIWVDISYFAPLVGPIDCWADELRLHYNNKTRKTRDTSGLKVRVPLWGSPAPVEWLDPSHHFCTTYFKDLTNTLVAMGYERNVSIRGAPYDFRKAPNEQQDYFLKLKDLVEDTYKTNNNSPVALIAHSMGGPMSLYFLHQQSQAWKDKYIRSLISLAAAWGGSAKSIKVYAVGDNLGTCFIDRHAMRKLMISTPSLAWMIPSALFWKPDEILVQTPEKNYAWSDMQSLLNQLNCSNAWEFWKDVHNFTLQFDAPGVEVHCLHGNNQNTIERLVYKSGILTEKYPDFLYGDGDGTVNIRSLTGCLQWKGKQVNPIYHKIFPNVSHGDILKDSKALNYIRQLLRK